MKSVENSSETGKSAQRFVCVVLAAWAVFAVGSRQQLAAEELTSIVLRVNDEIATLYDYDQRKEARVSAIGEASQLSSDERHELVAEAGKATMREMLDELLLLSRARQLIIEPSHDELDEAVDSTKNRMGLASDEAFGQALHAAGMTMEDFRERTARSIRVNQVIQREVRAKIEVDEEWMQRNYREHKEDYRIPAKVKVQEIVIPADKLAGEEARKVAESMRVALAGGEAMADVVGRLGGGDATGPVDLGWVEKGELAPALEAAVSGLVAGAVSSPVEARGGLHLLQVVERAESSIKPYADVKDEMRSREEGKRFEDSMRTYLADLEKKAYLVENTPAEALGYREVPRETGTDPLAAFAPKRAAAAASPPSAPVAPAPAPAPPADAAAPAPPATPPPSQH